jgi:hypothetical protein
MSRVQNCKHEETEDLEGDQLDGVDQQVVGVDIDLESLQKNNIFVSNSLSCTITHYNRHCHCKSDATMRGNQLPVSAARWLHGSQICFATLN